MHSILAASSSPSSSGGAAISQLLIFAVIGLAMYFLLIRPQRRRQREQVALQRAVEVGDEVMTNSGLYGFITAFDGDIAWLEVDDDVSDQLVNVDIPALVVVGNQDILTPRGDSEEIADRLPNAELVVISGAAHGFMVEHATTFNRVLLDFLGPQRRGGGVDLHLDRRGIRKGVDIEEGERESAQRRERHRSQNDQEPVPQ